MEQEIKGEDFFKLGGQKFNKDVTLGAAIKVLEEKNNGVREIKDCEFLSFSLVANSPKGCEFQKELTAQEIIDNE